MNKLLVGFTAGAALAALILGVGAPGAPETSGLHAAQKGKDKDGKIIAVEGPPLARNDAEKRILDVLDDLDKNQRTGNMNVPIEDGRLLRVLIEAVGAKNVVEIGTSNGYSGIWICLALRTTGGKLTTHELNPKRAALARENFKRAGVADLVTLVEGDAHATVTKLKDTLNGPIDVLFLDADPTGYVDYLNKLLPLVRSGGLLVTHNTRQPPPEPMYIKRITTSPELETIFLNMHAAGVGVTLKRR